MERGSLSSTQMTVLEKRAKLEGLRADIVTMDSELFEVQTKLDRLYRKKLTLEKEKKRLETEAAHLEQACKLPDVDLKRSDFQWSKKLHALKKSKFNISEFRPYQEEVINATMSKRDVILVMPTGGGKSLCFQLPALLCDGFTLVISPLVSLMEDQAMALQDCGIAAVNLSASTSREEVKVVHQDMIRPNTTLKLLYVTPEKIAKSKRFMAQLQKAYEKGLLARIAIDEVHCCSQWGHDFRPDYKVLGILKRQFSDSPIIGLTATASSSVLEDVKEILNMPACEVFRASYNRANLVYEVRPKPSGTEFNSQLAKMLQGEFANKSGIIYCFSRKETENLAADLVARGIMAAPYHAYMEPEERSVTHRNWKRGHLQVVVATTAFGMGIDKPDVRFVIHHSLSKSMENYYQESGRAGRDGKEAKCILFFGFVDVFRQSTMVVMEQTGLSKLYQMVSYCISKQQCRRILLAEHFDETWEKGVNCNGMCDACRVQATVKELDVTQITKTIYDILEKSSSKEERLTGLKLVDQLVKRQKGSSEFSKDQFCHIILHLLLEGHLKEDFHFTPYSTISYFCLGPKAGHLSSKVMVPMITHTSTKKLPSDCHQTPPEPCEDVIILDAEDELSSEAEENSRDLKEECDTPSCEDTVYSLLRQEFSAHSEVVAHISKVKGHSHGKRNVGKGKTSHNKDSTSLKGESIYQGQGQSENASKIRSHVDPTGNKKSIGLRKVNDGARKKDSFDRQEVSVFKGDCIIDTAKVRSRKVEVDLRTTSKMGRSKFKGSIKRKAVPEVIDLSDGGNRAQKKRMRNSNTREKVLVPSKEISEKKLFNVESFGMSPQSRELPEKRKVDCHRQRESSVETALSNHQNANLHNPPSNGNSKDNSVGSKLSVSGRKAIKVGEAWIQKTRGQVVKKNYSERIRGDVWKASEVSEKDRAGKLDGRNVGKRKNVVNVSEKSKKNAFSECEPTEKMSKNVEGGDTSMNSSISETELESFYLEQLSSLEKTDGDVKSYKHFDNALSTDNSSLRLCHIPCPSKNGKSSEQAVSEGRCDLNERVAIPHKKCDSWVGYSDGLHHEDRTTDERRKLTLTFSPDREGIEDGMASKDVSTDDSELDELATVYTEQLSSLKQRNSEDDVDW
ncbi:ATP-dependent DNA helicase Q1 [Holothuria leucospilota]|uniref:DNA 3'-5' helicase n=1 Tax=Holothuria leucospilota TaxID=206669 RepID=A0A9Q0YMP7_HOLLE|nr:ATP-dependent DNA helicase Q1 [Holothuria leucospilota]